MPTISPARTLRLTLSTITRRRVLRVVRRPVLDAQHLLADVRRVVGVAVLEVAADHVLDDALLGDVAACAIVSIVLPSRMTVTESAIFLISLSLWLMMIDVMPCSLRCRIRSSR